MSPKSVKDAAIDGPSGVALKPTLCERRQGPPAIGTAGGLFVSGSVKRVPVHESKDRRNN